ncbi:MAG: winged helix-turn-helix transcriptional regulator [Crenarchaeota archaeon]|nr:winged helix-turn-helix transcriptional regulator [Thermoproteota archaeon]
MSDEFEVIAEWTIRKLKDLDASIKDDTEVIKWLLYSLGVKDLGVDIYLYLRSAGRTTSTEIAERFKISPTTARRYLEQLHTLGLVDYIGREYHLTKRDIASCIRDILIPRIKSVLEDIASVAEKVEAEKARETQHEIDRFVLTPVEEEIKEIAREAAREALRDAKKALDDAREEALRRIKGLFSTTGRIDFAAISEILSKVFDALSEAFQKFGDISPRYVEVIKTYTQHPHVRGLSIVETESKIVYTVYSDYRLEAKHLNRAKEEGRRVVIRVFGKLYLSEDITPDQLDAIEEIYVHEGGELIGPERIIKLIENRIRGPGTIRYY